MARTSITLDAVLFERADAAAKELASLEAGSLPLRSGSFSPKRRVASYCSGRMRLPLNRRAKTSPSSQE
jgi:hypothetical protein